MRAALLGLLTTPFAVIGALIVFLQMSVLSAGALILLIGILSTSDEGITMDQVMNESRAVRNCLREVRDKKITKTTECSGYAQAHLGFFSLYSQSPASVACASSIFLREYHRQNYQIRIFEENLHSLNIQKDCLHPDVKEAIVEASLDPTRIFEEYALGAPKEI